MNICEMAKNIKDEEAYNCLNSGVPELIQWAKRRLE